MSNRKFIENMFSRGQLRPALPRRMRITIVIVAVALAMFAAWTVLAYSGLFDPVFKQKNKSGHSISIASMNANAPSKEYVYGGSRLIATEEPAPDTTPPTFPNGCPGTINVAAPNQCPYATNAPVTYATPAATDNSGSVTVSCNPPSGANFAVGLTTVTCTATDPSGNTATCSFVVDLFSGCLVDDSTNTTVVLFNAVTGDYRYCCNGVTVASGRGVLTVHSCNVSIQHVKGDRNVLIQPSGTSGTAVIKYSGTPTCSITDRVMAGDSCTCP